MFKTKNHLQEYKEFLNPPRPGEVVKGKVLEKTKEGVLLDLEGYKIGLVKKEDLNLCGKSLSKIKKGEEIFVKIIDLDNKNNIVEVSLKEAQMDLAWQKFQELVEKGEKFSLKVAGANRGGLIFNISGVQGFLPASQLSRKNYPKIENPTPDKVFEELKKFVGKEMKVKILRADPKRGKLIFSER